MDDLSKWKSASELSMGTECDRETMLRNCPIPCFVRVVGFAGPFFAIQILQVSEKNTKSRLALHDCQTRCLTSTPNPLLRGPQVPGRQGPHPYPAISRPCSSSVLCPPSCPSRLPRSASRLHCVRSLRIHYIAYIPISDSYPTHPLSIHSHYLCS